MYGCGLVGGNGGAIKFYKTKKGNQSKRPYSTLLKKDGTVRANIKHKDWQADKTELDRLRAALPKRESAWNIYVKGVYDQLKYNPNYNVPKMSMAEVASLSKKIYQDYKGTKARIDPSSITEDLILKGASHVDRLVNS